MSPLRNAATFLLLLCQGPLALAATDCSEVGSCTGLSPGRLDAETSLIQVHQSVQLGSGSPEIYYFDESSLLERTDESSLVQDDVQDDGSFFPMPSISDALTTTTAPAPGSPSPSVTSEIEGMGAAGGRQQNFSYGTAMSPSPTPWANDKVCAEPGNANSIAVCCNNDTASLEMHLATQGCCCDDVGNQFGSKAYRNREDLTAHGTLETLVLQSNNDWGAVGNANETMQANPTAANIKAFKIANFTHTISDSAMRVFMLQQLILECQRIRYDQVRNFTKEELAAAAGNNTTPRHPVSRCNAADEDIDDVTADEIATRTIQAQTKIANYESISQNATTAKAALEAIQGFSTSSKTVAHLKTEAEKMKEQLKETANGKKKAIHATVVKVVKHEKEPQEKAKHEEEPERQSEPEPAPEPDSMKPAPFPKKEKDEEAPKSSCKTLGLSGIGMLLALRLAWM